MSYIFIDGMSRKQLITTLSAPEIIDSDTTWLTTNQYDAKADDCFWVIKEKRVNTRGKNKILFRGIFCFKLEYNDTCKGYGYKEISESEGPSHYNCPIKFIEQTIDPMIGFSTEWRQTVTDLYNSKKAEKCAKRTQKISK